MRAAIILFFSFLFSNSFASDSCEVFLEVREGQNFTFTQDSIFPGNLQLDLVARFSASATFETAELSIQSANSTGNSYQITISKELIISDGTSHSLRYGPVSNLAEFTFHLFLKNVDGFTVQAFMIP